MIPRSSRFPRPAPVYPSTKSINRRQQIPPPATNFACKVINRMAYAERGSEMLAQLETELKILPHLHKPSFLHYHLMSAGKVGCMTYDSKSFLLVEVDIDL
jgi:hypothetical protein